ncbi:MAG: hypothetical protein D0530_08795 [Methylococcales bacterium]|nr:MAG: hypothetical protein D0530_08795 [Methylococcales bacterium]
MAKDINDKSSKDLFGARQGAPGRPVTGKAMTDAARQKAYRARRKTAGLVDVHIATSDMTAKMLGYLARYAGKTQGEVLSDILEDVFQEYRVRYEKKKEELT